MPSTEAAFAARRALIRSWPRNRDREAGFPPGGNATFEKDHAVPAVITSYGVSLSQPIATIGLEDADGTRREFRLPVDDVLRLITGLSTGQLHQRLLDHSAKSSGTPSREGLPADGQVIDHAYPVNAHKRWRPTRCCT